MKLARQLLAEENDDDEDGGEVGAGESSGMNQEEAAESPENGVSLDEDANPDEV